MTISFGSAPYAPHESVAGWTYRVVARSSGASPRGRLPPSRPCRNPAVELCDELERNREKYRAPILLCDLEELTHDEAAARLRQPARTLRRRLSAGRELLCRRLSHLGLSLPSVLFAARGVVPIEWSAATVRVALRTSSASARVSSWVEGVIATMFWTKLKVAVGCGLLLTLIAAGVRGLAMDYREEPLPLKPKAEAPPAQKARPDPKGDPKRVIGQIADHIRDNYARIHSLHTTITTTNRDRSVTKKEESRFTGPDGMYAQVIQYPLKVTRDRLLIRGENLLREPLEDDGHLWSFFGETWTQYVPKHRMDWLKSSDQMASMLCLDPRNIASLEVRRPFLGQLRDDRVLEAGPSRAKDGQPRTSVLLERDQGKGQTESYRCEFDPAKNDHPTRVIVYREGDSIGIVLDIDYQEVIPDSA
ncbi:RNA polymerase sigma factor [Singulisphaera sp. PoT]|uniref:RNA polymerase sigma factor n=1 Tax=Singulisphaera sp. PoT TaxID=3411797 RepID=UPI003BF52763